jgi:hypothetical protein
MKVLELFSGTGSVGKVCKKKGWDVVSVDLLMEADHQVDILDFDYKQYESFDIIWASPPCTEYSYLQNCWIGRMRKGKIYTKEIMENDMKKADELVKKTLEIIDYFKPKYWFIENPRGRLKDREIIKHLPFDIVDYCMYSDWGYKKTTYIWNNNKNFKPLRCNNDCGNIIDVKGQQLHKVRMGTSKTIKDDDKIIRCNTAELREKYKDYKNINKSVNNETKLHDRYRIPEKLIEDLFNF